MLPQDHGETRSCEATDLYSCFRSCLSGPKADPGAEGWTETSRLCPGAEGWTETSSVSVTQREIQGFKLNPTLGWQTSRELCHFHSHVCSAVITGRVDWLICSLVAPRPSSPHDKELGSFAGFSSFDSVLLVPLSVCFSASHLLKGSASSLWGHTTTEIGK